jgi:hypothetical protein
MARVYNEPQDRLRGAGAWRGGGEGTKNSDGACFCFFPRLLLPLLLLLLMMPLSVSGGSLCRLRLELRLRYGTAGGSGAEDSKLVLTSFEDREVHLEVSMPVLVGGGEPNGWNAASTSESLPMTAAATAGDGVDEAVPGGTVRRLRDEEDKNATRLVLIFRLPLVERSNKTSLTLASAPPSPPP